MTKCDECYQTFNWDDDVVNVDDRYFHKKCVILYPVGYIAFSGEDCIVEVEKEGMACLILGIGNYEEETE